MFKKKVFTAVLAAAVGSSLLVGAVGVPQQAVAASNMVPNYEVKLLMDPSKVLGSDFKLTSTVKSAFGMPDTVTKMNVEFLDTNAKDIYNNGWSPRVRKTEGEKRYGAIYRSMADQKCRWHRYGIRRGSFLQNGQPSDGVQQA